MVNDILMGRDIVDSDTIIALKSKKNSVGRLPKECNLNHTSPRRRVSSWPSPYLDLQVWVINGNNIANSLECELLLAITPEFDTRG